MENLKLFYRIVLKNREVYFLKIITLAIAFGSSVLILLFSINEFGFDRFHSDADRIFRVLQRNNAENFSGIRLSNQIPDKVFQSLRKDSTIVLSRVKAMNHQVVLVNKTITRDLAIHAADSSILDILSFDVASHDHTFQNGENVVMISSSLANRLFGSSTPDQELKICAWNDTVSFRVGAVFEDFPSNSHETFSIFIPFNNKTLGRLGFQTSSFQIYGKTTVTAVEEYDMSEFNPEESQLTYRLQSLPDIYFGPRIFGDNAHHGDNYSILILISISSLVLFLAVTGFINLTALTLPYRAKEIAIKKLAGNDVNELLISFAKESFSITLFAFLLGTGLLIVVADWIAPVLSIDIITLLKQGNLTLIGVMFFIVMIVGIAPLMVVIKFLKASPVRLLSTDTITFPKLKRVITCVQLGVSIFLIVASMVIKRQINRSLIKEPGRNYDQVVYLTYPEDLTDNGLYSLRSQWRKFNPNIVDVMATSQLPDRIQSKELNSDFYFISVNPSFMEFFNLRMASGNWFKANNADSAIVVNKQGSALAGSDKNVIGVIEDIGSEFHLAEKPLKINLSGYHNYNFLCIRILEVEIRRTLKYLSESFAVDGRNAQISFLSKRFEEWLKYQDRLNSLSDILTLISALLACCSIYGLSVSLVRDKLKQIAVHKLYGAAVIHITKLLVKEFARQLGWAILIFAPVTYIVVNELLRNFVYTTHFEWLDPVIPIAYCSIVITLLCGIQALSLNRSDLTSALKG